ncbi:DAK2 domain-containing protein [Meiothermus granaticius]|uniref:DAK2 domain fusion protein YloV n=1 Tax=Meiothermus granaticius NBRC 107808 TaxID=1227551 RepID=A0A399F3K5_9DEIN|nr:DAK2 domain-containing protein [Meiothermus granaticius]RIH90630.1 DAK2 domain fusion protein YloV [Meiothermus granaticius NBRC 107808]GEM88405.1 kinase [Meiothermus granaticius NBRC 107808]
MAETLSPQGLAEAFRYATDWFAVYVEETNALNVYPVPDGDTGTNMHLTLQSVRRELDLADTTRMGEVARAISYGSLLGARGNSGVITSQILKGFAETLKNAPELTPALLVAALEEGSKSGYRAVMKPVEGTILTVSKGIAEGAKTAQGGSLEAVLSAALVGGRAALERTPELLPVLKQAGVVDAGGAGLLRFLEGLDGYLEGLPLPRPPKVEKYAQTQFAEEEFGYCTEFLMDSVKEPVEKIRALVAPFGDSLLVVGAEGYVKGHIHTNDPDGLLATVARYGHMVRTKVEDMSQQHTEILSMAGAADEPAAPTGLVAVATGWGLVKALRDFGARIVAGGQTANPSVQDILDAIKSLPNPEVIVLPNNSNVIMSAQQAAELARESGKQVTVIPTRTLGAGLAASVQYQPDASVAELVPEMQRAADQALTLEVTRASRSVEIGDLAISEGQPIGLKDDKLVLTASTPEDALFELVAQAAADGYEVLTVFHGPSTDPSKLEALSARLNQAFPDLSLEVHPGGPDLYDYLAVLE